LLGAADLAINGATEVAIVGDPDSSDFRALTAEVGRQYLPALVLAGGTPGDGAGVALLEDREAREGRATGYVCRQYLCSEPTSDPRRLASLLDEAARTAKMTEFRIQNSEFR
jgi:uncharacterized protein YyaL (SSP411 family)